MWLRPVERTVRVREVGGSNPLTPTQFCTALPEGGASFNLDPSWFYLPLFRRGMKLMNEPDPLDLGDKPITGIIPIRPYNLIK